MSAHTAEKDACPQWCLNRLAPQCVIHRPSAEKDALAELIWNTSRADEGTISATGANIIARAIRERFGVQQVWCVVYDSDTPYMDGSHQPLRMAEQSREQAERNFAVMQQRSARAPKRNLRIETRFVTEWTRVLPPGEVTA